MKMHSISKNIERVEAAIIEAARSAGRDPGDVCLVAVSKTRPASTIRAAYEAGLTNFGENYLQEALTKIAALEELPLTWHFIGAVQSNKTRPIAEHFHWVHTVDRRRIAQRLSDHCPAGKTLDVCLQVNIDSDPAKSGVQPDDAGKLLRETRELPRLRVRGLMTILAARSEALTSYQRLAKLFEALKKEAADPWDTLSMGMSKDFRQAIIAGATLVRVGTDIFGPRS